MSLASDYMNRLSPFSCHGAYIFFKVTAMISLLLPQSIFG